MHSAPKNSPKTEEKIWEFKDFHNKAKEVLTSYQSFHKNEKDPVIRERLALVENALRKMQTENQKSESALEEAENKNSLPKSSRAEIILALMATLRENQLISSKNKVGAEDLRNKLEELVSELSDKYIKANGEVAYEQLITYDSEIQKNENQTRQKIESLLSDHRSRITKYKKENEDENEDEDEKSQYQLALKSLLASRVPPNELSRLNSLNIVLDDLLKKQEKLEGYVNIDTPETRLALNLKESRSVREVHSHISHYLDIKEKELNYAKDKPFVFQELAKLKQDLQQKDTTLVGTPWAKAHNDDTQHRL